jgi:hypothetical protein
LVSAVELGYSPHGILDGGHKGDMETRSDLFCGTWELDPATLDYQYGRPGRRAIYTIEKSHEGLQFVLDADDADGKQLYVTYGGPLDGREQPLAGTDAVLVLTRYDDRNIESTLKRGGKVADRWTREVLPDGNTMRIMQHGFRPDGEPFSNVGLYRRTK